jgi:hypothetical protein
MRSENTLIGWDNTGAGIQRGRIVTDDPSTSADRRGAEELPPRIVQMSEAELDQLRERLARIFRAREPERAPRR